MAENMTGQQALDALLPLGFTIDRVTDRVYVKKGAMKFTLPKGDNLLSLIQANIINGVVQQRMELAQRTGSIKKSAIPLMVLSKGKVYAVVDDLGTRYRIQDLEEGTRTQILKTDCVPYEAEIDIPQEEEMPKLTIHEQPHVAEQREVVFTAGKDQVTTPSLQLPYITYPIERPVSPPPPPPVREAVPATPASNLTPLTNPTDFAAMVRLIQRQMLGFKIEFEQEANKLTDIIEKINASATFLKSLGVTLPDDCLPHWPGAERPHRPTSAVDAPRPGSQPRPVGGRGNPFDPATKDRIRMAYMDLGRPKGRGSLDRLKEKARQMGVTKFPTDSSLYNYISEWNKE